MVKKGAKAGIEITLHEVGRAKFQLITGNAGHKPSGFVTFVSRGLNVSLTSCEGFASASTEVGTPAESIATLQGGKPAKPHSQEELVVPVLVLVPVDVLDAVPAPEEEEDPVPVPVPGASPDKVCLLYTSDAADD